MQVLWQVSVRLSCVCFAAHVFPVTQFLPNVDYWIDSVCLVFIPNCLCI